MKILGVSEKLEQEIIELAVKYQIEKVVVFGSRARGDYHRTSDIDLAVLGGNVSAFTVDVDELTRTLLAYDIVDLNGTIQKELLESIEKEGVIVYEKV